MFSDPRIPGGIAVTYTFQASEPGTYLYETGTQQDLQREMGLVGALIVRPTGFDPAEESPDRRAYNDDPANPVSSAYEQEYLYFLTEMDENIHDAVEAQVEAV